MQNFVSSLDQDTCHQQASMTVRRIFLAAHQGDAKFRHAAFQPFNPSDKAGIRGDPAVKHVPIGVVILRIVRPSTQFPAQKQIFDTRLVEEVLENLTIELRRVAGVGRGTDIDKNLDGMLRKQLRQ